jgi:hypothetical protein
MPGILAICQSLEHTWWATAIRQSLWMFPIIETIHLFGIVLLVAATTALDLRLLNLSFKERSVSGMAGPLSLWAWAGFIIQLISGFLLFASEASKLYANLPFRIKMILIVVAGANILFFHYGVYRTVDRWDASAVAPAAAKVFGVLSILLWFGIVAAGRWIAFVSTYR